MARREWQDPSIKVYDGKRGPEYYIRYRVKVAGQPKKREQRHILGLCSEMTLRQAERKKAQIMREVNDTILAPQSAMAFAEVLRVFREQHIPTLADPSQKTYRQHLHAYIEPHLGAMRLCDIGTLQIERMFTAMQERGLGRGTRNTTKGILKSVWGCARKWQMTDANPVKDAKVGGGPRHVRECRVPSLDEVGRLMDQCEGDVPLLIETLYTTGMRISEAAGLLVGDLDFTEGVVFVRRRNCRGSIGDTKSEKGRRLLGLGNVAVKLMAHIQGRASTDRVFSWKERAIVDNTLLADYLTPIMERLGMKFAGFGWHTFRRLHLTLMDKRGLSMADLQRQAGHADIRTTMRYIAEDITRRRDAAKDLPYIIRKGA